MGTRSGRGGSGGSGAARLKKAAARLSPVGGLTPTDRVALSAYLDEGRIVDEDWIDDRPPQNVVDIVEAANVFTQMNVDTVRNPSLYDASKASKPVALKIYADPENADEDRAFSSSQFMSLGMAMPSAQTYRRANAIMTELASVDKSKSLTPNKLSLPHYRGLSLPKKTVSELRRKGGSFDVGSMSSFTTDRELAGSFAEKGKFEKGMESVLVVCPSGLKRGTHIANISKYRYEKETVTSGGFRVLGVELKTDGPTGLSYYEVTADQT